MRTAFGFTGLLVLCFLSSRATILGQTTPARESGAPSQDLAAQLNCQAEKNEPFATYCEDVKNFLTQVGQAQVGGKVDRSNNDVRAAMRPFLDLSGVFGTGSDVTRFTSLLARDTAIQGAINVATQGIDQRAKNILSSEANQSRPDQQIGAGSKSSGTTSLVEKAGGPAILAFALESGALTRSVSGNTATVRGNADGMLRAFTGKQVLCFDCGEAMGTPVLRNLNLSASFLINQQSSSSLNTTGPANSSTPSSITSVMVPKSVGKLDGISASYELRNPYDPRSNDFKTAWDKTVKNAKAQIDEKAKALQADLAVLLVNNPIKTDQNFQKTLLGYRETFYDDADAGNLNKLKSDFLALYKITVNTLMKDDPHFTERIQNVNLSLAEYKQLWSDLIKAAQGPPLLTLQYSFNRPQDQPETHDFRVIYGYSPKSSAISLLSVNAAISLYGGSLPTGAKYGRLRDGQIAAQLDRAVGFGGNPNQSTLSLAGYWQYQPDPTVLNITSGNLAPGTDIQLPGNAQVLLGTSGSLWVAQAKFMLNAKAGIKIPVSVNWSNKTDLLVGHKVGAQIGISYDFSSLSSVFGSSTQ